MARNEVVQLPQRIGSAPLTFGEIERLAEEIAKSGLFGIKTKSQALVLMSISQAEGRHPALAARDYDIIAGRPAKKAEAMLRDMLDSGGKVKWHELTDTAADATFSHPSGGEIRIRWDTERARNAGLASKDMWRKFPRQMLRSRCVSEGVKTVCPMATSGMYTPEEQAFIEIDHTISMPRDGGAAPAHEAPSDTTADLDQFAAVTGDAEPPPTRDVLAEAREHAERGRAVFTTFWQSLSAPERDSIRSHLAEFQQTAKQADDPFGLPPLEQHQAASALASDAGPAVGPDTAGQPFATGDVFTDLDREARAATKDGLTAFAAWWKTLRRGDADLIRAFLLEYEHLAAAADAQRGLAL